MNGVQPTTVYVGVGANYDFGDPNPGVHLQLKVEVSSDMVRGVDDPAEVVIANPAAFAAAIRDFFEANGSGYSGLTWDADEMIVADPEALLP